jgi:hypothetical protein
VVRQLLTNELADDAVLDDVKVPFVKTNFVETEKAFSSQHRQTTESTLHRYEAERANRLFN